MVSKEDKDQQKSKVNGVGIGDVVMSGDKNNKVTTHSPIDALAASFAATNFLTTTSSTADTASATAPLIGFFNNKPIMDTTIREFFYKGDKVVSWNKITYQTRTGRRQKLAMSAVADINDWFYVGVWDDLWEDALDTVSTTTDYYYPYDGIDRKVSLARTQVVRFRDDRKIIPDDVIPPDNATYCVWWISPACMAEDMLRHAQSISNVDKRHWIDVSTRKKQY